MKKLLFVIFIFQSLTIPTNAQDNKEEIKLDQVELISSPRIEISDADNSISILTINQRRDSKEYRNKY